MIPKKRPITPEWDRWALDFPFTNAIIFGNLSFEEEVTFAENYIKSDLTY